MTQTPLPRGPRRLFGRPRLPELALLALVTALGAVVWFGARQMSPAQGNETPVAPIGGATPEPINNLAGRLVYSIREDFDPIPVRVADLATGQQVSELSPWQPTAPEPSEWTLSPDGRWLALDNGLMEVRDVGGQATLKASMPAEEGSFRVEGIHWAANGRALYYGVRKDLPYVDDGGRFASGYEKMKELAPNQVLIAVEGSHHPIALGYTGRDASEPTAPGPTDPEPGRRRHVSYFAAASGEYLSDQSLDGNYPEIYRAWLEALVRRPTAETVLVASATPTASVTPAPAPQESPTPNPSPTPGLPTDATEARQLTAGQVPAALVDAARELGEVPGSRWVYRVTENWFGPHWSQRTVTETIPAAWLIAPDAMMLERGYERSAVEAGKTARYSPKDPWRSGCNDTNPYFLFPNGRIGVSHGTRSGPTLARIRQLLDGPSTEGDDVNCDVVTQLRPPLVPNTVFAAGAGRTWWQTEARATVDVPAGRFDGCIAVVGYGDDRNETTHWTCPRVGVVRHEVPSYTMAGGGFALYELIDYDIPPIVPVR